MRYMLLAAMLAGCAHEPPLQTFTTLRGDRGTYTYTPPKGVKRLIIRYGNCGPDKGLMQVEEVREAGYGECPGCKIAVGRHPK